MNFRHILYLLPLLVFLAMSVYFAIGLSKDPSELPSALINKPVPEFDLPPLMEDIPGLATADFGGEVVIVNVFASWCVPCRIEHPMISRMANEGIVPVYGLNWKDEKTDAKAWLKELGNPYSRIGWDLSGRVGIDWGVYGVPETYIIGKQGRIRYKHVGPILRDTLNETLIPIIQELQAE
ncbi:MAG: DsbE family thiol:disulfide interchange protein [Alphaproteobacteria bacterium]|nr:DsbE family thiol:disulfide interchange protein [Alphaproteobacteria bacterium]